jgi:hypothetical protein
VRTLRGIWPTKAARKVIFQFNQETHNYSCSKGGFQYALNSNLCSCDVKTVSPPSGGFLSRTW